MVSHYEWSMSLLVAVGLVADTADRANYLGQKFTLPIVLSRYSNDKLAFWFTLLPATITSAYYCLVARPRQKMRRDR